jgi:hypothetical protein
MKECKPETMMKMMRSNPSLSALVIAAPTRFQKQPLLQTSLNAFVSLLKTLPQLQAIYSI